MKGGDNMDRATILLNKWAKTYADLLMAGMPEEDIIAGLALTIEYIAEKDPELFEELAVTAEFENLLNGME